MLGRTPQARPVELVAYTLEEPPHFRSADMGSVRHARALKKTGRAVRLMLSLKMIGYFSDAPGSQQYLISPMRHLYPDKGDFIALVGKFSDFGATRSAKALMAGATVARELGEQLGSAQAYAFSADAGEHSPGGGPARGAFFFGGRGGGDSPAQRGDHAAHRIQFSASKAGLVVHGAFPLH
ncbi:hypothetical protein [Massilia glaciei]|uniref:Uncharacterized protein n=1 Tax=Massilia glaciei TaxID=1524097 RepID=A0A2U2HFS3_9BURK|nr:hypothetical protein [Massilia glaciei]PWF43356.1 hypothetical protein C7C56_021225 [Massilia glaciei]